MCSLGSNILRLFPIYLSDWCHERGSLSLVLPARLPHMITKEMKQ